MQPLQLRRIYLLPQLTAVGSVGNLPLAYRFELQGNLR